MFPDEFSAVFLAQVTAFAVVQIWRSGRQSSRQELGNSPRPAHDAIRLILTGLAVVCGLVLLIIFMAHPIANFAGNDGFIVPVVAFLIFIYVVLVVGI
jgi:peptidoglycan/LPS O-acetylase OafA/YrhL